MGAEIVMYITLGCYVRTAWIVTYITRGKSGEVYVHTKEKKQRIKVVLPLELPLALPPQSTGITIFFLLWQLWQHRK